MVRIDRRYRQKRMGIMRGQRKAEVLGVALLLGLTITLKIVADRPDQDTRRDQLNKAYQAGNYKDAYEGLRSLALHPDCDPLKVGADLTLAIQCLQNLGRSDEID